MIDPCFNPFPEIETQRLILRPFIHSDAEVILYLKSDSEMMRYINKERLKNLRGAEEWIETVNRSAKNNEGIVWAIAFKNKPADILGYAGFWRIIKAHHRAEIGYTLHRSFWKMGIMNEVLGAILPYGFESMQLHSVEAIIHELNIASENLLIKNGFVKEAHFKENYFFEGEFLDSVVYSLLASKNP